MQKGLIALLLLFSSSAFAQHFHHHHHRHGGWHYNWIGPTIIGGVIGYEIARSQQPAPVIIQQQPPIIIQQPPIDPNNYVIIDGVTYRKQLINDNGVWREVLIRI